jgi:hypothetical protein
MNIRIVDISIYIFIITLFSSVNAQEELMKPPFPETILSNEQLLEKYSFYCTQSGFNLEEIKKNLPNTTIYEKKYDHLFNSWRVGINNKRLIDVRLNITNGHILTFWNNSAVYQAGGKEMGSDLQQIQSQAVKKAEDFIRKLTPEKMEDLRLVKTRFNSLTSKYWEFEWRKKYKNFLSHDWILVCVNLDITVRNLNNLLITTCPSSLDVKITPDAIEGIAKQYGQTFVSRLKNDEFIIKTKPKELKIEVFHPNHIPVETYSHIWESMKDADRLQECRLVWTAYFEEEHSGIWIWVDAITGMLVGADFSG